MSHAVQMERFRCRGGYRRFARFSGFAIDASAQCLEKLTGILKITPPQYCRTFARQPIGSICCNGVVCNGDPIGWRSAGLGAPTSRVIFTMLDPTDNGVFIHGENVQIGGEPNESVRRDGWVRVGGLRCGGFACVDGKEHAKLGCPHYAGAIGINQRKIFPRSAQVCYACSVADTWC